MPYPYLGTTGRTYPQYRDTSTGATLVAEPDGSYDMEPVTGAGDGLAVPPADGQWGNAPVIKIFLPELVATPVPEPEPAPEPVPEPEVTPEPEPVAVPEPVTRKPKASPPARTATRTSKAGQAKEG